MTLLDYYKLLTVTYSEQITLTKSEEKLMKITEYFQEYLEFPNKMKNDGLSGSIAYELVNGFKVACSTVLLEQPKVK